MKARHKDTGEIIELAEEGIISRDGRRFCWYQVELIPELVDECKPSIPSNLDEAADKFAAFYDHGTCDGIAQDCFKAGAEWMAGQGETIGTFIEKITNDEEEFLGILVAANTFKEGDKVIVQIRKNQ